MPDLRRSKRLRATAQDQPHASKAVPRGKRKATDLVPPQEAKLPASKRLRLTEENLSRYRRLHQRSRDQDGMGRQRKTPSAASKSTVTTTDRQFASKLFENGVVYEMFDAQAPSDLDHIQAALLKVREVPLSAHKNWAKVREAKRLMAQGELSLESMIVESMFVHHDSPFNYLRYRNDQWTEIDNEITAGISDPKPDVTEAYTWSAYPPGTREDIDELAPSQYGYAMPTFAMESKGPSGDHEQAIKQAAYDGAVMTHAALAVDGHVSSGVSQSRVTKAITMTLSSAEINVYANHAILEDAGNRHSYHQYRVVKVLYLDSEEEWNRAHMVVTNAQELALWLADTRVKAIWDFSRAQSAKQAQMKAKGVELHIEAQAKARAAMAPPDQRRKRAETKKPKLKVESRTKVKSIITPPSSKHDG